MTSVKALVAALGAVSGITILYFILKSFKKPFDNKINMGKKLSESMKALDEKEGHHVTKSVITSLKIFDFDGTLFKSPLPSPSLWESTLHGKIREQPSNKGLGWFQEVVTLDEPFVPRKPSNIWFNEQIVSEVLKSMNESHSATVLLTGRNTLFESIIRGMVQHRGLVFDDMGFKPHDKQITTMKFKKDFILSLIEKYKPLKVEIWEDRPKHQIEFEKFFKEKNITGVVHMVDSVDLPLPEEQEVMVVQKLLEKNMPNAKLTSRVMYSGVKLTDASRTALLENIPVPTGWTHKADHVTMKLGPIDFEKEDFGVKGIGETVKFKAIKIGRSDRAIAVAVEGVKSTNVVPHVTIAVSSIGKPRDSNLIEQWEPLPTSIPLEGKVHQWKVYSLERPKTTPKKTGFAELVKRHHPTIDGKKIGSAIKQVENWVKENQIEDVELVEKYIRELTL